MSNNKSTDNDEIEKEIMNKLREQSKKRGSTINELLEDLLSKSSKDDKKKTSSGIGGKSTKGHVNGKKTIDVTADLSKLLPHNNPEFIEILRRIAESVENIEREHAQGWSDQRKDLQAISKRMDKLL